MDMDMDIYLYVLIVLAFVEDFFFLTLVILIYTQHTFSGVLERKERESM